MGRAACEPVGEGVHELREHLGTACRVYFGRHGQMVVILLYGGSKKSQSADIKTAKEYWADWKRRQDEQETEDCVAHADPK
ncbi:MAG TPA: type II toxin-antitoxin system RelE/ParE family toxin [Thiobacillaceae bacterium]|nr:type II toxin-antitoxin system RelE/ParE family toxin [Thiobacillaceae bacterium]